MVLTQNELNSHLYQSANILRGSIDSSEYKQYIFGMLFLKRLSDQFDENVEKIKNELIKDGLEPAKAENIAKNIYDCKNILITSGICAREYYKKLNYKLVGPYMHKKLLN